MLLITSPAPSPETRAWQALKIRGLNQMSALPLAGHVAPAQFLTLSHICKRDTPTPPERGMSEVVLQKRLVHGVCSIGQFSPP